MTKATDKCTIIKDGVHVYDEFGELKEVIIGSPLAEEDTVLKWTPGMNEEFSWMKPETFQFIKKNAGKTWKEADETLFNKINYQVNNYIDTMEGYGVKVHRLPRLLNEDRNYINPGIEQIYPRDVWCTAGNTVVISALRMPWKRKQYLAGGPLYVGMMAAKKCNYIQAPQPSTEVLSPPERKHAAEKYSILFDGGDFMPNGDEIYIGQGHGSNALGANFCESVFGDQFTIYPLKLSKKALHLDCTIALIRPGLGIICPDWLESDLPPGLKDYKWIEATEDEAAWLGVNGIAINKETYMIDSRHERLIKEIRRHGVNVVDIPYDGPSFLGGSLRCSSQPIYRSKV
jgi:glycine amidinotransferase